MVNTLSKTVILSVLAVAFLFLAGTVAEASYYTDRYGSNSYSGRDKGGYFSFPAYPGSYEQTQNRNNLDANQFTTQNTFNDRNLKFGENVRNRNIGANLNFNQDRLNLNQDGRSTQNNFDTGSISYSIGDGTQPTYQRVLTGNFRGKRNDFTITETIFGGEKIDYNRNFGNRNTNTIGYNSNRFSNNIQANAGLTDNTLNRNIDLTQRNTNKINNKYSLVQSDFGSGFRVMFN